MQNAVKKWLDTLLNLKVGDVEFGSLLLCKFRLQLYAVAALRNSVDLTIKRL